jgi:hypothetical protein
MNRQIGTNSREKFRRHAEHQLQFVEALDRRIGRAVAPASVDVLRPLGSECPRLGVGIDPVLYGSAKAPCENPLDPNRLEKRCYQRG